MRSDSNGQHSPDGTPATWEGSALADRGALASALSEHLVRAWTSFDTPRPADPTPTDDLVERLRTPLPAEPGDVDAALEDAVNVLEASVSPSRPLYLAYVGSSGLETSVLAAALAAAYDANLATVAGAADLLDQQAAEWLAEFVGFPLGEGHFTSGGQSSNLTALLAAREHAIPGSREHGMQGQRATIYCSAEAHHSVIRAAEAAGLGRRSVRRIPLDDRRRMDTGALAEQLDRDRADGFTPVAVVATAGTTLTGAVDPLDRIADVCATRQVWMHVDGAYGLPAAATGTAGHWFTGLDRADSVTIDAHKWLGMQKSCSAVLLRHRGVLRAAFGHDENYMLHDEDTGNPVDSTLEYSRPFRSLRLWLSMRVYGADRFRGWIETTLAHAARLAATVEEHPDLELLHTPMLSTVCFRHRPPGMAEDDLDAHNERLAREMQHDGRVFLAPAEIDGMTCLRVCFVNFRTRPEHVDMVLPVLGEVAERLRG